MPWAAFPGLFRIAASGRLEATWYAPRGNRKLKPITGSLGDLHVQIFTHPDFLYDHEQPAEELPGRELWPNLANRQDNDAVAINPNCRGATWSPHVPALVVAGHWPGPLPLRSEAELALYLDRFVNTAPAVLYEYNSSIRPPAAPHNTPHSCTGNWEFEPG